jgi:hypothetical protein
LDSQRSFRIKTWRQSGARRFLTVATAKGVLRGFTNEPADAPGARHLNSFPQVLNVFGCAFAGTGSTRSNGLFAPLAQVTLERIPPTTDSFSVAADLD